MANNLSPPLELRLFKAFYVIIFLYQHFRTALDHANAQIRNLSDRVKKLEPENERLRSVEYDYNRLYHYLGKGRSDEIINEVKDQEVVDRAPHPKRAREYAR